MSSIVSMRILELTMIVAEWGMFAIANDQAERLRPGV
jgi:hypothetical protein